MLSDPQEQKCTRCQNKDRNRLICIRKYLEIKDFPEPISSLTIPMEVRPAVNPSPIPIPSKQTAVPDFGCITLGSSQNDTVYYDQRNIKSQ